mgnify:CR=1 FL=1
MGRGVCVWWILRARGGGGLLCLKGTLVCEEGTRGGGEVSGLGLGKGGQAYCC